MKGDRHFEIIFDHQEAKGVVVMSCNTETDYGPSIKVDGEGVGWVDLFPPAHGDRPALLVTGDKDYEPLVKVFVIDGKAYVTLARPLKRVEAPSGTHPLYDGAPFYTLE